jgi:hypothetical protein
MVIVNKPCIKVLLYLLKGGKELLSEDFSEELVQDCSVKALNKPVGPWGGNFCQLCNPPFGFVFCAKNILTEEDTDCH